MRSYRFILLAGIAGLFVSTAASAADLGIKKPSLVPVMAQYNWTGLYAGVHAGAGWVDFDRLNLTTSLINGYNSRNIFGGLHLGYNHQFGSFVLGAEGSADYGNFVGNDKNFGGTLDSSRPNWRGSLRARLGYAFGRVMIYGTGGWAFTNYRHVNTAFTVDRWSRSLGGWTLGGGAEYALTTNWLLRAEYRYTRFANATNAAPANLILPYRVKITEHTASLGVSYKF